MIGAVVLAAGQSRRMGTQKLLLPYRGTTVIDHVLAQVSHSPVDCVVVVVGQDPLVTEVVRGHAVQVVANPDPHGDMLSSARCGVLALPPECEAVVFALGDQPLLDPATVACMVDAHRSTGCGIIVPTYAGRRGHPLLVSLRYREEMLTRYENEGLRGLLQAHPLDVQALPADSDSVLSDLDTPEDYEWLLRGE